MEEIKQFDIVLCDFSGIAGLDDYGKRPSIVVSNDANNKFGNRVTVVPLTTQSKTPLPTHCVITSSKVVSFALCENVTMVLKTHIDYKLGELTEFERLNVIYCLKQQFDIL